MSTPKELADVFDMHSFEVESITKKGNDWILDVKILPNRAADAQSYFGLSLEILANAANFKKNPKSTPYLNSLQKLFQEKLKTVSKNKYISLDIKSDLCRRYTAVFFENVKMKETPLWIKQVLEAHGQHSINMIVDIANFVMLETGQPLHVFDTDKMKGDFPKKIIVRSAKENEKLISLEKKEYMLKRDNLVIADNYEALALAGIKGGESAEITSETENIILEAANFDGGNIRKTSASMNLRTDASIRFQHNLDPILTEFSVLRFIQLIKEYGRAEVKEITDYYPKKEIKKTIKLDFDYLKTFLGRDIPKKEILGIIKNLGFSIDAKGNVKLLPFRKDINTREDLAEEIGRIYSYDKIPPVFPAYHSAPAKNSDMFDFKNKIKDLVAGFGFDEIYSYNFVSEENSKLFFLDAKKPLKLLNPINSEKAFLRSNLMNGLLESAGLNSKHIKAANLFEIGKIFYADGRAPQEKWRMGILVFGKENSFGWNPHSYVARQFSFYAIKGMLDALSDALGVTDVYYDLQNPEEFMSVFEQGGYMKSADKIIGFMGVLNSKTREMYDIKEEASFAEIDLEKLMIAAESEIEFREWPKFPAVTRDISVLINEDSSFDQIMEAINRSQAKFVENVELFDYFENPEDKNSSFSFHVIFRSLEYTLTSEQVDEEENKIKKALKEIGAEIR